MKDRKKKNQSASQSRVDFSRRCLVRPEGSSGKVQLCWLLLCPSGISQPAAAVIAQLVLYFRLHICSQFTSAQHRMSQN